MSDNLWDGNANCYAYSCNDPHAPPLLNGSACPGGIARQGVFARKGESEQDFAERLIKGVLLDGGHNNLVISVSRDIDVLPDAGPGYVTAMVSNATGYHFLRQDRETKTWSWKDGNFGSVDGKAFLVASGEALTVTGDVFKAMVNPETRKRFVPEWPMIFRAYFGIGNRDGMRVSGIAEKGFIME